MRKGVAPCGESCALCERNGADCMGCRAQKGKVWWLPYAGEAVCPIYACCVDARGLKHCGACDRLPCERFTAGDPTKSAEENAAILKNQLKRLGK